jgi:digalactosyldiacylglycerol synthase
MLVSMHSLSLQMNLMGAAPLYWIVASNEFFLPFPNCLPYDSIEECAEKLKWALEHDPQPLTEEHIRAFSWEGATDRLFVAAHMTIDEKKKRDVTDKEDKGVARFHVESMIKGQLLTKFFAGEK